MLQTLSITAPIYFVIAVGYLAVRFRAFSRADLRVLGTFVVHFALPALVFLALTQRRLGEIFDGRYVVDYAVGSLVVMATAFAWGWWRQGKSTTLSALSAMGMACSNSGFIGYPIATQVVGAAPAAVALAMCMIIENLLMIPLALAVADSADRAGDAGQRWYRILLQSLAQLMRKPLILAILAALVVQLANGVPLPGPVTRTIGILATASTALSLFVIGGSLVGLQIAGLRRGVSAIAAGKLVLHPLVVTVMLWLFPPPDPSMRTAATVYAAMPMLGIYPILAQRYGLGSFSAAALLLTTLLSFTTINAIIALLR